MLSEEILAKIDAVQSAAELQALAKELGYDLTEEEAQRQFAALHDDLSEEELGAIAGGLFGWEPFPCEPKCSDECPYDS